VHANELRKQFPDQLWIGELDVSDLANIPNTFRGSRQAFRNSEKSWTSLRDTGLHLSPWCR
jgi:hypothetical protein